MNRRCSSAQALDAWVVIRDALAQPDFCIHAEDCEAVTRYKLERQNKIRNAINVISSFIVNPERSEIKEKN